MKRNRRINPQKNDMRAAEQRADQRLARHVAYVTVPLAVVTALVLTAWLTWALAVEPRLTVAEVVLDNGAIHKITGRDFLRRLKFERAKEAARPRAEKWGVGKGADYRALSSLGFAASILERMTREVLLREVAAKSGLSVNEAEINARRGTAASAFGVADKDLPPDLGVIVGAEILENKFKQDLFEDSPAREEQVRLKLLRFGSRAEAIKVRPQLATREEFDAFYDRAAAGQNPNAAAFARGWSSPLELNRELSPLFSEQMFRLASGERSTEPMLVAGAWYLAQCEGHETRAISVPGRKARAESAYNNWLHAQNRRVTEYSRWMALVVPMHQARTQRGGATTPPPNPGGPATAQTMPNSAGAAGKSMLSPPAFDGSALDSSFSLERPNSNREPRGSSMPQVEAQQSESAQDSNAQSVW